MSLVCVTDGCQEEQCVQLTQRELSVCRVICRATGPVSFGELKEKTELHQEVVSRVVRRLVLHGLVRKTQGGYLGACCE